MNKHNVRLSVSGKEIMPYVDDERIPFCKSVDEEGRGIKFSVSENPLELAIENAPCDLSDYVRFACIVLKDELLKHGDLYRAFSSSIYSALKDISEDTDIDEMPEIILSRIIGEEAI